MVQAAQTGCLSFCAEWTLIAIQLRETQGESREESTSDLFLVGCWTRSAWWTASAIPEVPNVDVQFLNGAAEGIAMHAELPRRPALIALVFFQHYRDKPALEFAHCLGIKNVAAVHLLNQCF